MKIAHILLISVAAVLLAACASQRSIRQERADRPGHGPEVQTAEERLSILKSRLNLTKAQVYDIRPIFEEEYERKREMMGSMRPGDRQGMSSVRQKKEDLDWLISRKLSNYLTPEQMELYQDFLAEEGARMEKMHSRKGGRGGPPM